MSTDDPTPERSERPADPEQPNDGFAEGEAQPETYPEDERERRFSEGQDDLPPEPTE